MTNIGEKMLAILEHASGFPKMNRKHYSAEPETEQEKMCSIMVGLGMMSGPFIKNEIFGDLKFYYITDDGLAFLRSRKKTLRKKNAT